MRRSNHLRGCGLGSLAVVCALLIGPSCVYAQGIATDQGVELEKLEGIMAVIRERNAAVYTITSSFGIDEGRYIMIGGIDQWITMRGQDRQNPLLLFLHGGPGDATNPWSYIAFRPWLKHFTVVQWDQRGAGRTLARMSRSASRLTLDRIVADGIEVTEWLRSHFGHEKVIVVGHSWGSILGIMMIKARPDLFHAFVGTGQVADPERSYRVAYAGLLAKAKAVGEHQAIEELQAIGPPPYTDGAGYAIQRKWANNFEGADAFIASTLGLALAAPGYTPRDVNDWLRGQSESGDQLISQTSKLSRAELSGEFAIPLFVFQGDEDFTTPTSLARELVASIKAPKKALVLLEGGHFAAFMKPQAFLQKLLTHVRPLATRK